MPDATREQAEAENTDLRTALVGLLAAIDGVSRGEWGIDDIKSDRAAAAALLAGEGTTQPEPTEIALIGDLGWLEYAIADYIAKWGEHWTGKPYLGEYGPNIAGMPTAMANMAMTVIHKNLGRVSGEGTAPQVPAEVLWEGPTRAGWVEEGSGLVPPAHVCADLPGAAAGTRVRVVAADAPQAESDDG